MSVGEQAAQQLGGALAAGEPPGVEREVEVPDVLRSRALVEAADAVADPGARQHPGEHLDEHRERVALVAAERDGGVDLAGSVVVCPCASTPQPSGISRPSSRALKMRLTATWLVAMSVSKMPSGVGAASAIGLVPSAWPMPP